MILSYTFENNLKIIIPEIFLFSSIVVLLFFGCFIGLSLIFRYPLLNLIISKVLILVLVFSAVLMINNPVANGCCFNGCVNIDDASFFVKLSIVFSSICCFLISNNYIKNYQINNFEFFIVVALAVFGLNLLVMSSDFLTSYIVLELQSFCFYILAAFKRSSAYSTEAGLKYFLLGSFSSTLLVFGITLIYGIFGTVNFSLLHLIVFENNNLFFLDKLGFIFIFVGLLFKLAAAPFHIWSPDVYEGSPLISTIFFAVVPKISILLFIFRVFSIISDKNNFFVSIFLISSVFSVIVGSLVTLKQKRLKKLLAYSSVNHVGYLLLGVSLFSIESISAVFFYVLSYMITSLCVWSIVFSLQPARALNYRTFNLVDFGAVLKTNLLLASIFGICLFSMAGVPPLVGFYAKLNIFQSAINAGFILIACFIILMSVVSTFYYIRLIKSAFFENSIKKWFFFAPVNSSHAVVMSTTFILLWVLFFNPLILDLISYKIVLSLIF
jgi:NADH-quinone oxidoreductase subunit N